MTLSATAAAAAAAPATSARSLVCACTGVLARALAKRTPTHSQNKFAYACNRCTIAVGERGDKGERKEKRGVGGRSRLEQRDALSLGIELAAWLPSAGEPPTGVRTISRCRTNRTGWIIACRFDQLRLLVARYRGCLNAE